MSLNNESVDHADTPEEPKPRKGLGAELSAATEIQSYLLRGLKRWPFRWTNFVDRSKIILFERCLKTFDTLSILLQKDLLLLNGFC